MLLYRSSSTVAAALLTTAIGTLAARASAQEALEEIVVTALRRAESLQDAPATLGIAWPPALGLGSGSL